MKEFFKEMLSSRSSVSSKRFCGFIGWILCLLIVIYCTYKNTPAQEIVEMLFICSTSLLGIEAVTNIWKKNVNK